MSNDFEDHCWKDIVTPDILEVYACYRARSSSARARRCWRSISTTCVYRGGPRPPAELAKTHPNSCGEYAHAAIEPTKRLFAAARGAGHPDLLFDRRHARGEPPGPGRPRPSATGRRSIRPTTPSGRSSSRSRRTSSSPSSAPACSSARRSLRTSPSSACRR